MGRAGLVLLLLLAAARGHEGSGEPGGSPAPGPPLLPERCLLPKVVGRCRASFLRWWYNATSRTCQRFTYGGCGANLNNFLVEDKCRVTCAAATDGEDLNEIPQASQRTEQSADEEPARRIQPANDSFPYAAAALLSPPPGLCCTPFPRWWFDVETKTCRQFTYGGCRGDRNNCLSEAESLARCSESCAAPRLTGPCRAAFPRWYYDPAARACRQFIYGGCKGNKNNYLREEQCLHQCSGAAGGAEGPEPGVHSSRVVALAVLLAILVAVLLGSVVVFFVWLCRRNQELSLSVPWSPLDDKEYLMSNAYTL